MAGDALAGPLVEATRAAQQSVHALCGEACARLEHAQSTASAERQPALEAIAAQVDDAKTNLGAMRQQLETYRAQLTTASEHIQQLQDTSKSLETQLHEQVTDEAQLSQWLRTAALSPSVVRTVLHTPIDEDVHAWVRAVRAIEAQLRLLNAAGVEGAPAGTAVAQVRAVAEQAKTQAVAKIRPHLLALLQPIRTSVATTLPILQFSVLLPHNQPLYQFLAAHAPRAAVEVQLAYVNAARLYYETAFRRYVRELKRILPRWHETTGSVAGAVRGAPSFPAERLQFARPHTASAPVVLAYMSEDAAFRAAPEHLFHTLALVFSDTACSEYAFLARFFSGVGMRDVHDTMPAESMLSLGASEAEEHASHAAVTHETWRQVMEPAIAHFHELREAVLATPNLPVAELLVTTSLTQALLDAARTRHCLAPELESAYMRHLLDTWPLIARAFDAEVGALKALSVGAPGAPRATSLLERWTAPAAETPTDLAQRKEGAAELLDRVNSAYVALYTACLHIHSAHEGTLTSGLTRLRAELFRLAREHKAYVQSHPTSASDPAAPKTLCHAVAQKLRAASHDTHATQEADAWAQLAEQL